MFNKYIKNLKQEIKNIQQQKAELVKKAEELDEKINELEQVKNLFDVKKVKTITKIIMFLCGAGILIIAKMLMPYGILLFIFSIMFIILAFGAGYIATELILMLNGVSKSEAHTKFTKEEKTLLKNYKKENKEELDIKIRIRDVQKEDLCKRIETLDSKEIIAQGRLDILKSNDSDKKLDLIRIEPSAVYDTELEEVIVNKYLEEINEITTEHSQAIESIEVGTKEKISEYYELINQEYTARDEAISKVDENKYSVKQTTDERYKVLFKI